MSSKSQTLENVDRLTFNSPSELLTFSAEMLRKTKHPEKRKFVRETTEAFILIRGFKFKIADISVAGLKLEKKLLAKKNETFPAEIICTIGENIFRQKTRLQVVSKTDEPQTRFIITMYIGLPERLLSI